jgi:DNA-binding NtrC family response regulator
MAEELNILTIDDDRIIQKTLKSLISTNFIENEGFTRPINTYCADSISMVREVLRESVIENVHFDICFLDLSIEKKNDGFDLIPVIKHFYPSCLVVVVSGDADIDTLTRADNAGASGYIRKPFSSFSGRIIDIIQRVNTLRELETGY